jgi:hypothetical protein
MTAQVEVMSDLKARIKETGWLCFACRFIASSRLSI